ncbi:MAG TPA: helix-turn-helix domain-containing protein [Pseudolysinimonas sp.]|nr:helix-turn-helix domain-containing protein [Pseudolysinimonas sp.]
MVVSKPRRGQGSDALRDAAIEVAKERGLGKLSLREVAERGGVTHGLIRHHFGGREGLVSAAVEIAANRTHYLSDTSGRTLATQIDDTLGELRVQYEAVLSNQYQKVLDAVYEGYNVEVVNWLRERDLPGDETTIELMNALIEGITIRRVVRGESFDPDAALERFVDMLKLLQAEAREVPGPSD